MVQMNGLCLNQAVFAQLGWQMLICWSIFLNPSHGVMAAELLNHSSDAPLPTYLAQTNPLYGCWRLTYSALGTVHESLLRMEGYDGVMVTGFYDSSVQDTVFVRQVMRLKASARGILILGYNPVYAYTNRRANYSPDNFLFQVNPNGDFVAATCDDAGRCSPVEIGACPR